MRQRFCFSQAITHEQGPNQSETKKPEFKNMDHTFWQTNKVPARFTEQGPSQTRDRALCHGNESEQARQEMERVVGQPNAETQRYERVRVSHSNRQQVPFVASPNSCQPRSEAEQKQRLY